ncbi:MAG: NADH-quinone oxidoreductase subunit N [candidate division Zixibacteria bacterium]|nr:NADH-quinone oxidoreductase subunit N [candidate division Zixibacteria bacterium]
MPNLKLMLPELLLFAWAILVIIIGISRRRKNNESLIYITLLGIVISGLLIPIAGYGELFGRTFLVDKYAVFFKIIFLGAAFFAVASSSDLMSKLKSDHGEFFGLMLLSTVGMMFLTSTAELITLYVSLELTTIPLFVLAAYRKDQLASSEAGLKYLILGALSSAILLYGISLIYGLTGTTFLNDNLMRLIQQSIQMLLTTASINPALAIAIIMLVAGLGFKLALVPFHMWAPDVYEGAPTPVTAFLSVASKAAGVAALARIFYAGLTSFHSTDWGPLLAVLAAAAMIVGNITAVLQTNIKRMLAYSSIAHIGYLLIGFVALPLGDSGSINGPASLMFYLFAYMFANMGAFACAIAFARNFDSYQIRDYQGLSEKSTGLAVMLTIFLLSLAGIPPLVGFFGKYYVFLAGWTDYRWLVIIGILTSVIALYYYANVIKQMFFNKEKSTLDKVKLDTPLAITLVLTVIGTIVCGLYPEPVIRFAVEAVAIFPF